MQRVSSPLHYRFVLLGLVGAGKSATGNTILGKSAFHSKKSLKAVTQEVQKGNVTLNGLNVEVYDTPGFLSPGVDDGDIERKCQEVLNSEASVHTVFLLVVCPDRFTEQEKNTAERVLKFLGDKHLENTWILFTKGDELQSNDVTIEEYMEDSDDLKELVQKLDNRYHVFTNKHNENDPNSKTQVKELIRKTRSTELSISQTDPSHTTQNEYQHQGEEDQPITGQSCPLLSSALRITSDKNNNLPTRTIMLMGKTGVGKSATGNTILGKNIFRSEKDVNAVTTESSVHVSKVDGKEVSVIDTPGFFDSKLEKDKLASEFGKSLKQCKGQIDAFLLVFEYTRFTEQEAEVLKRVEMVFGKDVSKHIIIVFTHGDECDLKKLKSGIEKNTLLSGVINKCGGRYHIFNNKDMNNREQVSKLLQMIDTMVEENGGKCYTSEMLRVANMGPVEYIIHKFKEWCLRAVKFFVGEHNEDKKNDSH